MEGMHENKLHGQATFPYMVYRGWLPRYIRSYPLHWHEEMEFIVVTRGQGIVTVRANRYEVHQGDILVIPPQMLHGIEQQQELEMEYFNILFRLTMLEGAEGGDEAVRQLYDPGFPVSVLLRRGTELNQLLAEHMQELIENRSERDSTYTLMIRSHLLAILYYLLSTADIREAKVPSISYDSLKPALQYIQEFYDRDITVHQAAELCCFSDSYFMKLFRELTGISFTQYLKRLRLEKAEALLRKGQRVGEAAERVGFRNLSYFSRAFQSQYGVTPSQYRK